MVEAEEGEEGEGEEEVEDGRHRLADPFLVRSQI